MYYTKDINPEKYTNIYISIEKGSSQGSQEISKGKVSFRKKRCFGITRDPKGRGEMWVECDSYGDLQLISEEQISLLNVSLGPEKTAKKVFFNVDKNSTIDYSIKLQNAAVVDCCDPKVKEVEVSFTVYVKMEDDTQPKHCSGKVTLSLLPIDSCPEFSLENSKETFTPSTITRMLTIRSSSFKLYSPRLNMKVIDVYLEKTTNVAVPQKISDAVHLNYDKAVQTCLLNLNDVKLSDDVVSSFSIKKGIIEILPRINNYAIKLPINIDLSKIQNPSGESEQYNIVIEYKYWDDNNQRVFHEDRKRINFTLYKNRTRNELRVELKKKLGGKSVLEKVLYPNDSYTAKGNINVVENHEHTYYLEISNAATAKDPQHPGAGVFIRNLRHQQSMGEVKARKDGNILDVNDIFHVSKEGKNVDSITKLMPTEESLIVLHKEPISNMVSEFKDRDNNKIYKTPIKQTISFQYYVDTTGNGNPNKIDWADFHAEVSLNIEIPPAPEWLGVDFGTSAVVALYGVPQDQSAPIKDLVSIKRGILQVAYGKGNGYAEVNELGQFINSDILYNGGNRKEGFTYNDTVGSQRTNYREGLVLFSPGKQFDYKKLLPSLKSLMGYDRIPAAPRSSNESQDSFNSRKNAMPTVDAVYSTAYHQLFELYLSRVSEGMNNEKIVMTYPNTFATTHVHKLKEMAKACIPSLRDEYIRTISESDAIAYRYMNYRKELLGYDALFDKRVLVYDMGAGTLDITYFSNDKPKDSNVREIQILGKYGISKAGNYLDYVLAEVVVDLLKKQKVTSVEGGTPLDEFLEYSAKRRQSIDTFMPLKYYVRDILKPYMAQYKDAKSVPEDVMMPEGFHDKLKEIPLRNVFNHTKFKQFLKEISTDVIAGCRENFNGAEYMVNVVVFSGRMTCFQSIRYAVKDAIDNIEGSNDKIKVSDFYISKKVEDGDLLKSSVILGALEHVHYTHDNYTCVGVDSGYKMLPSKPFFCRYCVLLKYVSEEDVTCIVDNSTPDFTAKKQIDLTGVSSITLLQTYATDEEAILSDYKGDRNLTTLLVSEDTSYRTGESVVMVQVVVPENGCQEQGTQNVKLWLDSAEITALPHENIYSAAFRKSAWPIVFA